MKLKGTITEQAYRNELQASRIRLFDNTSMQRFLKIIREISPNMKTAYILNWIPEQGEDIFTFLVDTHLVLKIELERYTDNVAPVINLYPLKDFTKGLSKTNQLKIAVALELAKSDLNS